MLKKIKVRTLRFLINKSRKVTNLSREHLFKLTHETRGLNQVEQKLISNNCEKLKQHANYMAQSLVGIDKSMADATYVYYLTKQVAAVYESTINYLPVQVYNEFRNAIDHYFRSLANVSYKKNLSVDEAWNSRETQLKKVNGHIVRAFLDMVKITNDVIALEIRKKHESFGLKSLAIVDNGQYITKIEALLDKAQDDYLKAKLSESSEGGESRETINLFLESFSSHLNARDFFIASKKHFYNGAWKYRLIKGNNLLIGLVIGILVAIIGRLILEILLNTPKIQLWLNYLTEAFQSSLSG